MVATPEFPELKHVPSHLIYEVLNGRPFYYQGYRDVLTGKRTLEEIMGSSDLQAILVSLVHLFIGSHIDRKRYLPTTNESGVHLGKGENVACDIAIFEKNHLPKLQGKYFTVAPKIVLEVDIKVDVEDLPAREWDYMIEKTQRLFDFGVEKVIWIVTRSPKIMIAEPGKDWIITDWNRDILVLDECILNIQKLLDEEGISY